MVKFSFIIPHKNLPASLLRRCLDSIPHWEDEVQIIIVDDASDSNFVDFEHFTGLEEPCTEVYFTKEGKGPGYARNFGLKKAKGEWIMFADADDYYDSDSLVGLLSLYPFVGLDAIGFKMKTINIDKSEVINDWGGKFQDGLFRCSDTEFFFSAKGPVQKIVRRDFIERHHLRFDEIIGSEDLMFSLKLAHLLKHVALFNRTIYIYEHRVCSLETSLVSKLQRTKMNVSIRATQYLKRINKMDYRDAATFYLWRMKHSEPLWFCWFLIKECFILGPSIAWDDYNEVCKSDNVPVNPFEFIWQKVKKL